MIMSTCLSIRKSDKTKCVSFLSKELKIVKT